MMTDTIADMLTRIRNATRIERQVVDMPASKFKLAIAQVLKDEGFVLDYQVGMLTRDEQGHPTWTEGKDPRGRSWRSPFPATCASSSTSRRSSSASSGPTTTGKTGRCTV